MPGETIQIKRYPNRRLYARNTSRYVTLPEIEQMIRDGETVEVRDSQTGEDITRAVLTQIILERQPEKMSLFPKDMLHSIVRSNDVMSDFLRGYFRQSLTYLEYLQKHGTLPPLQSLNWMQSWLQGFPNRRRGSASGETGDLPDDQIASESGGPDDSAAGGVADTATRTSQAAPSEHERELEQRVAQLEERLRQLEDR